LSQTCKIRSPAPKFTTKAWWKDREKTVSLTDFRGKYVVLFFYPADWSWVCPTEICEFNDMSPDFEKLNCQVIGASTDTHLSHMEYTKKDRKKGGLGPMDIPLIGDPSLKISKDYCVCVEDGDDAGLDFRGTFIIDHKGILRHISISDLPVGRNVAETLRLVEAFQFTDKYGEVCPASWKKGSKTLKPSVEAESKNTEAYWSTEHNKNRGTSEAQAVEQVAKKEEQKEEHNSDDEKMAAALADDAAAFDLF